MHAGTQQSKVHFDSIQALRGIAALLVLAFHLFTVEEKYFGTHVVPSILGRFGTCGVDLFFVISGFVMVETTSRKFGVPGASATFLFRRAARIYPVYWLYSLVVLAVFLVMPQWVNASGGHAVNLLTSFTLFPASTMPLLQQAWTLTYEMFFYLVFAIILLVAKRNHLILWLAGWTLITLVLAITLRPVAGPVGAVPSDPIVLEFIGGCVIALIYRTIGRGAALGLIALAVLFFAVVVLRSHSADATIALRAVNFGIPAGLIVLGAVAFENRSTRRPAKILQMIGDASYSIYLSHILVISAVARVGARLFPHAIALTSVLCILIAIVVGYLSFRIVETPIHRWARRVRFDTIEKTRVAKR